MIDRKLFSRLAADKARLHLSGADALLAQTDPDFTAALIHMDAAISDARRCLVARALLREGDAALVVDMPQEVFEPDDFGWEHGGNSASQCASRDTALRLARAH